jgi:5,5'-dehydrodivanillate O-demethylase
MGDLMRRYWHPIAASVDLETTPFRTKEVRILGEDLVLYRDRSGTLGLIDRYCSHRRVNLAIGVVEEDGIRCQYHGWKFNEAGTCVEQPFEDTVHPEDDFRAKTGLHGYPVQELAGLIWAYMGPAPVPELPRWEPLTWANAVRDVTMTELPCNWLQCMENSLDPVHTEWLHDYFGGYVGDLKGRPRRRTGGTVRRRHRQIAFDVFEHGIVKRRFLEGYSGQEEAWRVGHPMLFPNVLLVGSPFAYSMQFRVPIDDTHTFHLTQYIYPAAPGAQSPRQASVPYRWVPLRDAHGDVVLTYDLNQDFQVWIAQGPVAQRDREKLGASDRGIILFRQLLGEQLERVREGEDPMNTFRGLPADGAVVVPMERGTPRLKEPLHYQPDEAGFSADGDLIEVVLSTWPSAVDRSSSPPQALTA